MSYQARNAKRAKGHFADTPRWRIDRDTERGDVFGTRGTGRKFGTFEVLQAFCAVNSLQLDWADEYGEPGYTKPEKGILFCNWNSIPQALQDRLEVQGYELKWGDEWYVDTGRSPCKAWRTQPDSWRWEPRKPAFDQRSPGLWGVESDCGAEYEKEIWRDQENELRAALKAMTPVFASLGEQS